MNYESIDCRGAEMTALRTEFETNENLRESAVFRWAMPRIEKLGDLSSELHVACNVARTESTYSTIASTSVNACDPSELLLSALRRAMINIVLVSWERAKKFTDPTFVATRDNAREYYAHLNILAAALTIRALDGIERTHCA